MGYNKEDYKRGSIGPERIREIVHEMIFKVDYKSYDPQYLERVKSTLADIISKIIYKKSFQAEPIQSQTNETETHSLDIHGPDYGSPEEKKRFNEKVEQHKTAIYIQRCLEFITLMDHYKELENLKNQFDAAMELLAALKESAHEDYLREVDYQNRIFAGRIELLIQQIREETRKYIDNLHKSIATREGVIQAARRFYADNIIRQADNIIVNGKKFFEGMDQRQIQIFVDGRLACMEFKERKQLELEFLRDQALEKNKKMAVDNKSGQFLPQSNKDNADARVLRWFNNEQLKLEQMDVNNLRRVAEAAGIKSMDSTADDKKFMKQIEAYDNNALIKAEQDPLKAIIRHEGRQIILEKHSAAKAQELHDKVPNAKDISAQTSLVDELLKQAHISVITNDSINLLNRDNDLRLKEIKNDIKIEALIAPSNMDLPNPGDQNILDIKKALEDSDSIVLDNKNVPSEISDIEFDDFDFESIGIEVDAQYKALQTTFEEIGATSIGNVESMDKIDFTNLRASPTLESKNANEAHSKRTGPM